LAPVESSALSCPVRSVTAAQRNNPRRSETNQTKHDSQDKEMTTFILLTPFISSFKSISCLTSQFPAIP
jgi:adenine-specific DNA glycosylase